MRNANKTLSMAQQKESQIKSQRDYPINNNNNNNYLSNNSSGSQSQQKQPLFTAQRMKFQSKSPPQNQQLQQQSQVQINSNTSLPLINQALNKNSSFLKQRKSYDHQEVKSTFDYDDYMELAEREATNFRKTSYQASDSTILTNDEKLNSNQSILTSSFQPSQVKLKLKAGSSEGIEKEILMDKYWIRANIPHIAQVIHDVKDDEGVEITINCNVESFTWIISYLRDPDNITQRFAEINEDNCLNLVVSTCFLGLYDLYGKIWRLYFKENMVIIINKCELNLKSINNRILEDIAEKIDDEQIEQLKERKDKFISQIYKAKAEFLIKSNNIQACLQCNQVLAKKNMKKISCSSSDQQDSYIAADGKVITRHQLEPRFNVSNFITKFREKYRICWKEIYLKLLAIVSLCIYCKKCDQWFPYTQLGHCRFHSSLPLPSDNPNEVVYICCMKNEIAFQGCEIPTNIGCNYDLHDPVFQNEAQKQGYARIRKAWLLTKDSMPSDISEKLVTKYRDAFQFQKPQSFNFEISLSKAYSEMKQQSQQLFVSQENSIYDDILFKIPDAQKAIQTLKNDKGLRDQISKEAKQIVRSRSPETCSSSQNLLGNSVRVTYDVDTNQMSIKKRSLSPQQIKEVQVIARKKIWECKMDIIREDDFSSMKMLTQLLKQQRVDESEQESNSQRNIVANIIKPSKNSFYININQINEITKVVKSSKDALNSKRSNNSIERRKKSPSLIIKQTQIMRKASPN